MIGIFDSGVGGLVSYGVLRRLLPSADICYLADRRHAPYGTKSKDELLQLVKKDIKRLSDLGADKILIACCTACTVYSDLSQAEKDKCSQIILPTAEAIAKEALHNNGEYRVTVIATERTCASHEFKNSVNNCLQRATVAEIAAQELVTLAEYGNRDGKTDPRTEIYLDSLCKKIEAEHPDALVLGCTHFSRFKGEFERRLSDCIIFSPAHIGARCLYNKYIKNKRTPESGKSLYTE